MKLPYRAHKFMVDNGFAYDYHHYMKYNGQSCDIVSVFKFYDGLVLNVMVAYPILSGTIVSPIEFSCLHSDGRVGSNPPPSEAARVWKVEPIEALLEALKSNVFEYLKRIREPKFLVSLYEALLLDHSLLPVDFDSLHLRLGSWPNRALGFACSLALAGRFEEANEQLNKIPEGLRGDAAARLAEDCRKRTIEVDPGLLNYYSGLRAKEKHLKKDAAKMALRGRKREA